MRRKAKLLRTVILMSERAILAVAVASGCLSAFAAGATKAALPPPAGSQAAVAASAPQAVSPRSPARISGVVIKTGKEGQATLIDVLADGPTPYHVFELANPTRLVVDLDGARNASSQWKYLADSPYVSRVRLGRFSEKDGGILRVVADLNGNPAFDVHAENGGIRIELTSREATLKPSQSAPSPAVAQKAAPAKVEEAPVAAKDAPPDYQSALPTAPSASGVAAPPPLEAPQASPASAGRPEMATAAMAAKIMAASTEASSTPLPAQVAAGTTATPQYTGEPISVNLKDVDLKDFFRLIHEISGLNIIVDPNVSGSVTMVLDDVPWDQALDIVLKNNDLGKQLEGNVLRIARLSTLQAEQEQAQKLAEAKVEASPLVTIFRPINYAKASTIAQLLKSWVGGGALSRRGSVLVDDRTNTLIISDIQQQIPLIEDVIGKLDKRVAQVEIQARIVRVTSDFERTLQSALATALTNKSGTTIAGGASGSGVGSTVTRPPAVTTSTAAGFGTFVISNAGARYQINAAIAAAENRDEAKTISRPSIVTQNNVQGTVIQGVQIPIQTTINNTISVTYVQASLQLQVTPQVTENGNVFLIINVTNSAPGPALTITGPSINTQSATTQVLVPDGGTVVFGGVTVTARSKSSSAVPWLGSIPIVGHLFKNTDTTSNDQELLFFVTPRVLTT